MFLPRELQLHIMTFVTRCELCDKCMVQKQQVIQGSGVEVSKDCPFTYWDTEGNIHTICNRCYWDELRLS